MPSTRNSVDCLLVGFNASSFPDYVEMVRAMGVDSGAYRDLRLAYVNLDGRPQHAMDVFNHYRRSTGDPLAGSYHNADFVWPVVLYLGSYLHKRGFSFDYVNLFQQERASLADKLEQQDVRLVAITTTLYVSPQPIVEIVDYVRRHARDAQIVVGGPYIANQAASLTRLEMQQLFRLLGADYYIISNEGEATLVRLLDALRRGRTPDDVPNLAYATGGTFAFTVAETELNPLEDNPVDYTLFGRQRLGRFLSVRTAKSCPFSCAFCGFPQRAGRYRYLDLEQVQRELDAIAALDVDTVTFLDDTFNVPAKRFKDLMRLMIRERYGFQWNCFYRSDHGDPETIDLMAEAGCEGVFLGIESGSDEVLTKMNKTARRADYADAIPRLRNAGISTYASVIVGFPGETEHTLRETTELLESTRPDFFRAQLWYCDPVTPIWNRRDELGIRGAAFQWEHQTMTSAEASDHIDRMFLATRGSIWLPQFGFEQWSTFYLQRHGLTLDQIKLYLQCFNGSVAERLLSQDDREVSPGAAAALAAVSSGRTRELPRAVERLQPERYRAAEVHWRRELTGAPSAQLGPRPSVGASLVRVDWEVELDRTSMRDLAEACGAGITAVSLAGWGVAVSAHLASADLPVLTILTHGNERQVIPLRLRVREVRTFRELAATLQRGLEAGAQEARFVAIATRHVAPALQIDVGFEYREGDASPRLSDASVGAASPPLGVLASMCEARDRLVLSLHHCPARLQSSEARLLAAGWRDALSRALLAPSADLPVSAIRDAGSDDFAF